MNKLYKYLSDNDMFKKGFKEDDPEGCAIGWLEEYGADAAAFWRCCGWLNRHPDLWLGDPDAPKDIRDEPVYVLEKLYKMTQENR